MFHWCHRKFSPLALVDIAFGSLHRARVVDYIKLPRRTTMMENVYVIKVKTKPPLSSLYPSERRYSASTVGGLCFVHFGLGALSLLLGTVALSVQGPILSVACLVPFVTGLLAWRRWYIDRNIAVFFYGNLLSLIVAVFCFIATAFDIAAAADSRASLWSLEKILEQPQNHSHLEEYLKNQTLLLSNEHTFNLSLSDQDPVANFYAPTTGIIFDNMSNISGYVLRTSTSDIRDYIKDPIGMVANNTPENLLENLQENLQGNSSKVSEDSSMISSRMISFWHKERHELSHTRILLTVNVLVASLLEALWSALSARIALRGMMNRLPESSYANSANGNTKLERTAAVKKKSPAPKPDILDHDRRLSERLENLSALHILRNSGPGLPLPESNREFRERVERFLANQAAHRVVEGSCS